MGDNHNICCILLLGRRQSRETASDFHLAGWDIGRQVLCFQKTPKVEIILEMVQQGFVKKMVDQRN